MSLSTLNENRQNCTNYSYAMLLKILNICRCSRSRVKKAESKRGGGRNVRMNKFVSVILAAVFCNKLVVNSQLYCLPMYQNNFLHLPWSLSWLGWKCHRWEEFDDTTVYHQWTALKQILINFNFRYHVSVVISDAGRQSNSSNQTRASNFNTKGCLFGSMSCSCLQIFAC